VATAPGRAWVGSDDFGAKAVSTGGLRHRPFRASILVGRSHDGRSSRVRFLEVPQRPGTRRPQKGAQGFSVRWIGHARNRGNPIAASATFLTSVARSGAATRHVPGDSELHRQALSNARAAHRSEEFGGNAKAVKAASVARRTPIHDADRWFCEHR